MDRRRDRKNATGSERAKRIIRYSVLLGGIGLLLSCSYENDQHTIEPPQQGIPAGNQHSHSQQQQQGNYSSNTELTMQQRFSGVLNAHNKTRNKHGLTPLKWSDKLASYSQEWANHLGNGKACKMYHRGGKPPFGENLYISSAKVWHEESGREVGREISPVTIKDVVRAWAEEEKWFNYQQNRCQPGQQCGHYTQMVWKTTTEVGCAMKVCGDKSQTWVCSYNPPGNYVGERPY